MAPVLNSYVSPIKAPVITLPENLRVDLAQLKCEVCGKYYEYDYKNARRHISYDKTYEYVSVRYSIMGTCLFCGDVRECAQGRTYTIPPPLYASNGVEIFEAGVLVANQLFSLNYNVYEESKGVGLYWFSRNVPHELENQKDWFKLAQTLTREMDFKVESHSALIKEDSTSLVYLINYGCVIHTRLSTILLTQEWR